MDTLLNIRAFLAAARAGSFSGAARQLGVAPSVITKRISRLEDQMRTPLFLRSTRRIALTEAGERCLPRYRSLLADIEDAVASAATPSQAIGGHVRIKAPTTVTILHLGRSLAGFQAEHPGVTLEIAMIDRSVNPVEEGYDIAIGALPATYANTLDEPLCPWPRTLCAAPAYLASRGEPRHPRDLAGHACLSFTATGSTWSFASPRGPINVEVTSRFTANDSQVLLGAALRGLGLAVLPTFLAREALKEGALVAVMADYPVVSLWLKALAPHSKARRPEVQALLRWLVEDLRNSGIGQAEA